MKCTGAKGFFSHQIFFGEDAFGEVTAVMRDLHSPTAVAGVWDSRENEQRYHRKQVEYWQSSFVDIGFKVRLALKDSRVVLLSYSTRLAGMAPYNSLYAVSSILRHEGDVNLLACDIPGFYRVSSAVKNVRFWDFNYLQSIKSLVRDPPGFLSPGIRSGRSYSGMIGQHRIVTPVASPVKPRWVVGR